MDLYPLLYDLVATQFEEPHSIHEIACGNGHLIGFAKVPDRAIPTTLAVLCPTCQGIARLGSPLKRGGTATPVSPPPKSITDPTLGDKQRANLAIAREVKRKQDEDGWLANIEKIDSNWDSYAANKPLDQSHALTVLIQNNPYVLKASIDPCVVMTMVWYSWDRWNERFVDELAKAWGCTSAALRQRIEKIWDWMPDYVRLKMPFVVEACIKPRQRRNELKAAQEKSAASGRTSSSIVEEEEEEETPEEEPEEKLPENVLKISNGAS